MNIVQLWLSMSSREMLSSCEALGLVFLLSFTQVANSNFPGIIDSSNMTLDSYVCVHTNVCLFKAPKLHQTQFIPRLESLNAGIYKLNVFFHSAIAKDTCNDCML